MAQLLPPKAPSLPIAQKEYSATDREQQNDLLRKYFNTLDMTFRQLLLGFNNYGTFLNTATQTPAAINTAYPITFNTTVEAFGVAINATVTSRIQVTQGGVYSLLASMQLDNAAAGVLNVYTWLRKNGVDVANSTTHTVVTGTADQKTATLARTLTLHSGDYIEFVWSSDSLNAQLHYVAPAAPAPATPAVLLSVTYLFPAAAT